MKEIPLIRHPDGAVMGIAIVDDEDFEPLNQHTWRFDGIYARRYKNRRSIRMHETVAEWLGLDMTNTIDHVNRDPLDNRRSNLRPATQQQQLQNRGISSRNTSGVTGVGWDKKAKKWRAEIGVDYETIHLGYFDTLDEARKAREAAGHYYFGEFVPTTKKSLRNTRPNTEFDSFSIQGAE
jgi:hypothetical protein